MTLPGLAALKREGRPVVMVTAYDFPGARAAEEAGVDVVLVGDSAAMTVLGLDSTTGVELEEMLVLARAVRRGLTTPLLVADLPFGSYEASDELAVTSAVRFVKEAGVDAVKLEGGGPVPLSRARAVMAAGIPVMGHVGLTPQSASALGGFRAQGRDLASATRVLGEAEALAAAGCFSVVLEAVPSQLTELLVPRLPGTVVIGIGAGPAVDGQVLVLHDLLGMREGVGARFVQRYADLQQAMVAGVRAYAEDVRERRYPAPQHGYGMPAEVLAALREQLG